MSRRGPMAAAGVLPVLWRVEEAIAQGVQPKRGGTVTSIVNNNQAPTVIVGAKIFQGLLRYDAKLAPMPELAQRWKVSADMQRGAIIEIGTTGQVFGAPKHAYTRALLDSIPGQGWTPPALSA